MTGRDEDAPKAVRRLKRWPTPLKCRIVEETFVPGRRQRLWPGIIEIELSSGIKAHIDAYIHESSLRHVMMLIRERATAIYTIIETAKLNGIDPEAYLGHLITRIADHPAKRIDELLPGSTDE
jgi:IS66 C-terminal element